MAKRLVMNGSKVTAEDAVTTTVQQVQRVVDGKCADLARKVLTVVADERLGENLTNEGDIAYMAAIEHVTAALRDLFAQERINVAD